MSILIGFLIALVVSAVALMVVSRLNLGLTVAGFTSAIIAALVIGVLGQLVLLILGGLGISLPAGLLGFLVFLVISVVVLLLAGRMLPGMKVNGFVGAIVASLGIAVVTWLIVWLLNLVGITL